MSSDRRSRSFATARSSRRTRRQSAASPSRTAACLRSAPTKPCRRRARRFDATGLHVLPGAIDVHVHFRDPGYPDKEDWASGTAAAAFGGVTTVFDMPNTIPPTGTAEILAAKHAIAASKACVDFGLYGLLGEDTIAHVPALGRRRRHRLQALYGQYVRQNSVALDRRDAGSLRGRGADRKTHFAACRNQFDHGAAPGASDGGGPAGPAWRISRRGPPSSPSKPSAAPPSSPNGPARAFISCTSRRPRNCGRCAKARRAASTSPAKPARIICCCRPTTITISPASSASIRRCAKRATRSRCGRRLPTAPST